MTILVAALIALIVFAPFAALAWHVEQDHGSPYVPPYRNG